MSNPICNRKLIVFSIAVAGAMLFAIQGCTTATYGQPFELEAAYPDRYVLKVYIGGFSGGETADNKAKSEIQKFMTGHGYVSYKVLNRTHNWVPSYFEYEVQFFKTPSG